MTYEPSSTGSRSLRAFTLLASGALTFATFGCSAGVDEQTTEGPITTAREAIVPQSSLNVLGFEATNAWTLQSGNKALSSDRTQGANALALSGLSNFVHLFSGQVSSEALPGLGVGSQFSLDVKLPTQQASQYWHGAIQLYVSVPSKQLHDVYLGQVEFTPLAKGKYVTLNFALPESAASVLQGATYSDLTFRVTVNVPNASPGTYRLDNLRLRGAFPTGGVETVQAGESVTLKAWKGNGSEPSQVDDLTFDPAIVQIPARFHVLEGNAGTGTLHFEYAAPGGSLVRCTYGGEAATSGAYYKLTSCANGLLAGDLTAASRLKLTVVSGNGQGQRTKVRAQIAKNPLGDQLGSIAPIPTYFGSTPAETATIMTNYIDAQKAWPNSGGAKLIRVATPELVTGPQVVNNGEPPAPLPPGVTDPPFHQEGRITGTDLFDAKWSVDGALLIEMADPNVRTTSLRSDAEVRGLLLGLWDESLANVSAYAASTVTRNPDGTTTESHEYEFCAEYLGQNEACVEDGGSQDFPIELASVDHDIHLFTQLYWLFMVSADLTLEAGATVDLGFVPNGLSLGLTPYVRAGLTVDGSVGLAGFLGGGLSGDIDLIDLQLPATLSATAVEDRAPRVCAVNPSMAFSMNAVLGAGGGQVNWFVQGGLTCGFWDNLCWREEGKLFDWPGLEAVFPIVTETPVGEVPDIPLDPGLCPTGISLYVSDPFAGQEFLTGQPIWTAFSAERLGAGGVTEELCAAVTVTSSNPGDTFDAADNGQCERRLIPAGTGPRTLSFYAEDEIGSSPVVTRDILLSDPAPGEPPVPSIASTTDRLNCQGPHSATFTGSFVYGGNPDNVDLVWFKEGIEVARGVDQLTVSNSGVYWLVAVDPTVNVCDENEENCYPLQSAVPFVLRYSCVR
jgi:hypothetical protein